MEKALFDALVQSLKEANAIARGEAPASRRIKVTTPDAKAVREQMSADQKARLDAVAAMPDEQIDYTDAPHLPDAVWTKAAGDALPPERTKLGSMLASIAREAGGLTDAEAEAFNQLRDKEPAIQVGETSPHEIGGLSPADRQCVVQALLAPPPPSPALDRAFSRRSDLLVDGALSKESGSAARLRRNDTD